MAILDDQLVREALDLRLLTFVNRSQTLSFWILFTRLLQRPARAVNRIEVIPPAPYSFYAPSMDETDVLLALGKRDDGQVAPKHLV